MGSFEIISFVGSSGFSVVELFSSSSFGSVDGSVFFEDACCCFEPPYKMVIFNNM